LAAARGVFDAALAGFSHAFPGRLRVSFDGAAKVLHVGFDFDFAKSASVPLDFSFGNNLPVRVETGGLFNVAVTGAVKVELGADLSSGIQLFLFPETS